MSFFDGIMDIGGLALFIGGSWVDISGFVGFIDVQQADIGAFNTLIGESLL